MKRSKSILETCLSNDRWIVLAGIAILSVIAWIHMAGMAFRAESMMHHWNVGTFSSHLIMWIVMMVAMMLPTAGPMILTLRL